MTWLPLVAAGLVGFVVLRKKAPSTSFSPSGQDPSRVGHPIVEDEPRPPEIVWGLPPDNSENIPVDTYAATHVPVSGARAAPGPVVSSGGGFAAGAFKAVSAALNPKPAALPAPSTFESDYEVMPGLPAQKKTQKIYPVPSDRIHTMNDDGTDGIEVALTPATWNAVTLGTDYLKRGGTMYLISRKL